jgi:hypothetical protein
VTTAYEMRWRQALWFLSLDAISPFTRELWIPDCGLAQQLTVLLRPIIQAGLVSDDYYTNFGLLLHRFGCKVQSIFPDSHLEKLERWVERIFIQAGSDRADENAWAYFAQSVHSGEVMETGEQDHTVMTELHKAQKLKYESLRYRIENSAAQPLSSWDSFVAAAENTSITDVSAKIKVICYNNLFLEISGPIWNGLSESRLVELYRIAKSWSAKVNIPQGFLSFPGNWQLKYIGLIPR